MIFLYINAIYETMQPADFVKDIEYNCKRLFRFIPATGSMVEGRDRFSVDLLRVAELKELFGDFDRYFDLYSQKADFGTLGQALGLEMKTTNTIIEAWPCRVKEDSTREEFEAIQRLGHTGMERYVEWRRATSTLDIDDTGKRI
jgi:hypothetical protein